MTSHDREFMNRTVSRIVEVAHKTITTYSGNYDYYEKERAIRLEQLLASHRRQQEMLAKEEEFIARFAARASHAAQVQSRVKKLEKIERIEIPAEQNVIRFEFQEPPRSGDDVYRIDNLGKVWTLPEGGEKSVFGGVSGTIRRTSAARAAGRPGGRRAMKPGCCAWSH